jgi:hypothetical protein
MKALIKDNVVKDVVEKEFPVHNSFTWMEAPEGCQVGWVVDNGVLVAPPSVPDTRSYKEKRMAEYPDIGDQLDAIWKQLTAMRESNSLTLITEAESILLEIEAVKLGNPKE